MSIRTQILLTFNLLTTAVALVVGWQSSRVATAAVEKRLLEDSVKEIAGLISEVNLPLNDRLMNQLATVLNCEVVAIDTARYEVIASSFADVAMVNELTGLLPRVLKDKSEWVTLSKSKYLAGAAAVPHSGFRLQAATDADPRLLVMLPEERVKSAQHETIVRIAALTLIAIGAATGVGFLLSMTLTRPVRQLVQQMEDITDIVQKADNIAALEPAVDNHSNQILQSRASPPPATELNRLSKTFSDLLQQLKDAYRRLDRAARLAGGGQMSAGVAHELRNPLSSIKMNARVLLDEPSLQESSRRSADLICREIDRMDLYLQELLQLRNTDGPATETPKQKVELGQAADSVLKIFADRARRNRISIKRSYGASDQVATVYADRKELRQVIMNLLINALEAAPANSEIDIKIRFIKPNRIQFAVVDQGPGISDSVAERVFEPFVTTKPRGTGLGLFICRQIINRYEGEMTHWKQDGKNAVGFTLPTDPESGGS